MSLALPWNLLLLLPLLAVLISAWRSYSVRPCLRFSQLTGLKLAGADRAERWNWPWPWLCVSLGLICLVLALARPQRDCGIVYSPSQGLDIMICLDTSGSMSSSDIAPSRIEAAKQVSRDFVSGRAGDRIGLIVFGGIAVMDCPLTVDHLALDHYIESLNIGITGVDNTALGDGVAAAAARLAEAGGEGRVIIAVTDGRNNVGEIDPYMAARMAAENNIRLYTVGIGAPLSGAGGPLNADPEDGLDESCLREMATLAGGQYYRATDARSLAEIYKRIDGLEKRVFVHDLADLQDLYAWPALFGALLIALGLILENTVCVELP